MKVGCSLPLTLALEDTVVLRSSIALVESPSILIQHGREKKYINPANHGNPASAPVVKDAEAYEDGAVHWCN